MVVQVSGPGLRRLGLWTKVWLAVVADQDIRGYDYQGVAGCSSEPECRRLGLWDKIWLAVVVDQGSAD